MGNRDNISYDQFPKQGSHLGRRVEVCFHYNTSRLLGGTVIRDDHEEPWVTIIALDDGRYVLADECQYHVPAASPKTPGATDAPA